VSDVIPAVVVDPREDFLISSAGSAPKNVVLTPDHLDQLNADIMNGKMIDPSTGRIAGAQYW
jgi:hypothetical protein